MERQITRRRLVALGSLTLVGLAGCAEDDEEEEFGAKGDVEAENRNDGSKGKNYNARADGQFT